jgi:hypothetical protein
MAAELKPGEKVINIYTNEIGTILKIQRGDRYTIKYSGSNIPDDQKRRDIKPLL